MTTVSLALRDAEGNVAATISGTFSADDIALLQRFIVHVASSQHGLVEAGAKRLAIVVTRCQAGPGRRKAFVAHRRRAQRGIQRHACLGMPGAMP